VCVGRAHRAPRIDVARRAASVARVAVARAGVVVVVVIIVRVYVAVASSELRRSRRAAVNKCARAFRDASFVVARRVARCGRASHSAKPSNRVYT
jgi:Ni,Fe-hydrogenase I cytochrome b subunit